MVIGHILYFNIPQFEQLKDANGIKTGMAKIFSNIILVQYLRLMQIIMIVILVVLCCPLFILCSYFRRGGRPRKADNDIIKNLNKISIEDFRAYKRCQQRKREGCLNDSFEDSSRSSLLESHDSDEEIVEDMLDPSKEGTEEHVCSICLEDFKEGTEVVLLPCRSHTYHVDCIEKWLKVNSLCPECRFQVTKAMLGEQKKQIKKARGEIKRERRRSSR